MGEVPSKIRFIQHYNFLKKCPCERCKKEISNLNDDFFKLFGEHLERECHKVPEKY